MKPARWPTRPLAIGAGLLAAATFQGGTAQAGETLTFGNLSVTPGLEIGLGLFHVNNAFHGLVGGSNDWAEGFIRPSLDAEYPLASGSLYGRVSAIGAMARGDDDAAFSGSKDQEDLALDEAYVGLALDLPGGWTFDTKIGAFTIKPDDGFLWGDADIEGGSDTTLLLAPRTAFREAAQATVSNDTWNITGFYGKADDQFGHREVVGGDVGYTAEWGKLGINASHLIEDPLFGYKGMDTIAVRANDIAVPGVQNLTVSGNLAKQFGSDNGIKYDTSAYSGEARYTFANVPWTPIVSYRYSHFSGDPDGLADGKQEMFDPLFYDFTDLDKWALGHVGASYFYFNAAMNVHQLSVQAFANENTRVFFQALRFDAVDPSGFYAGPATASHLGDEINLAVDWWGRENVYLLGGVGALFPGKAAEQILGTDKTTFQVFAMANFKF
ncbi:alginate export family protein [Defluviimonas salinarum]|uniref:Alginate export family protein n=1 Tax=Defluviimonas salinarum TaxID=2992147 RepID=A0ABT3J7H5_9RHOB|nr:alginate export family protein [Defluviimonas salinarum]MCW3783637.1 alginate export family protein [Defluviimonas salinarum]